MTPTQVATPARRRSPTKSAPTAAPRRFGRQAPTGPPSSWTGSSWPVILGCVAVLNMLGLVMVLSASSVTALYDYGSSWHFFLRQAVWVVLGFVAMLVVMRIDYRRLIPLARPLVAVTFALLVLVLFVGLEVNGAQRWLGTESLSIQPSELAKLALVLFTADLLARRADKIGRSDATLRPVMVVLGGFAGLVMLQPNLGTTVVLAAIAFSLLFVAGTPLRSLATIVGAGAIAAGLLAVAAPYRLARIKGVLDPWSDPLNTGYQSIQSQLAIASGGLFGRGLGAGRAKWEFLPEAHTDFIFAIIAEELGLIGALAILALFVTFAVFGFRAARRAPDLFGTLLATGITTWIVAQAVVNLGAVVGLLPITGVPLPFVSFGGSAMVVTMAATGVLVNVARQAR